MSSPFISSILHLYHLTAMFLTAGGHWRPITLPMTFMFSPSMTPSLIVKSSNACLKSPPLKGCFLRFWELCCSYLDSTIHGLPVTLTRVTKVLVNQKETQKQVPVVATVPITKEGKRIEAAIGKSMERLNKANSDAHWALFQEEFAKQEKSIKDQHQFTYRFNHPSGYIRD